MSELNKISQRIVDLGEELIKENRKAIDSELKLDLAVLRDSRLSKLSSDSGRRLLANQKPEFLKDYEEHKLSKSNVEGLKVLIDTLKSRQIALMAEYKRML